jgi:hypothetical protein
VNPYSIAWLVAVIAGLLGTVAMLALTRHLGNRWLRRTLSWLPPLLLLVPAEVPGFDGNYAPAFVVVIFEALFQVDGEPVAAARMLIVTGLLGLLMITIASRFGRGSNRSGAADAANSPDAQ